MQVLAKISSADGLKAVLEEAGVDVTVFNANSFTEQTQLHLQDLMAKGWKLFWSIWLE